MSASTAVVPYDPGELAVAPVPVLRRTEDEVSTAVDTFRSWTGAAEVGPSRQTSAQLIDEYIGDMRRTGRMRSIHTERGYRRTLGVHAKDAEHIGLFDADRLVVKRTLLRWPGPNSQRHAHACLVSFYKWMMEEGLRPDNPAERVRRMMPVKPTIYRLTRAEVGILMDACETERERRLIYLGLCTGARRAELMGLRGRDFARKGWVHIRAEHAKGKKDRWIPAIPDLEPICADIRSSVALDGPVLESVNRGGGGRGVALDHTTIGRAVGKVAARADIAGHVTAHTMRHAFATHVARYAGLRAAQLLLGHADISTTARIYVETPSLDEIADAVEGFSYRGAPSKARPNLVLVGA